MPHIERRRFLIAAGSAGLAALAQRPVSILGRAPQRVVVVGGGIIGASIAYHLAKRGAEVTVLEKTAPAAGATANSFAWINAGSKRPRSYYQLNHLGMAGWRRLQGELGPDQLVVQWGGTVQWHSDSARAATFKKAIVEQQRLGYSVRLVDAAELRQLVPTLEPGSVAAASFCDEEGTVDPVGATRVLLEAAASHGATIRHPAEVSGFDVAGGRVRGVRVGNDGVAADAVVLAAGVEITKVGAMLDIHVPMQDSPGLLAHTKPHARLITRVVVAPGATLKQLPNGKIVTGVDFGGSPSLDTSDTMGRSLIDSGSRFLPKLREATLDRVTLGWRVMPRDGHPIVGRASSRPNVYLAAMHSGITLAPVIGQLAALELLDDVDVELLAAYRLSRFAK